MSFPKNFLWGAASAAYQIEGAYNEDGKVPGIWDALSEGHVKHGENGNIACDHYHRYKEDVALLKKLGAKAYRFSVSWPRVMSGPDTVNPKGLAFYSDLVDELKAAGIEPLNFDDLSVSGRSASKAAGKDAVIQIVEVRRALESEVAELAAKRRTPADIKRIRDAVKNLANAVKKGQDGVKEDVAFHHAIAQTAGNPFLISTLDYLAQYLRGATRVTRANEARRADFTEAVTTEHARIVQAIADGDAAAARQAATDHMNNAIARIKQADDSFWAQSGEHLAQGILKAKQP